MILYFSGTGNSKFAAEKIAEITGDTLVSLNQVLIEQAIEKSGRGMSHDAAGKAGSLAESLAEEFVNEDELVFSVPTYAWRIPNVIKEWIENTDFAGKKKVWFVMTCGSEIGNAAKYNLELCEAKGFEYMGTLEVVMPENYIAMFNAPDAAKAKKIIEKAIPGIEKAAGLIAGGEKFPAPRNRLYYNFVSGPMNPMFYSMCVKDKKFVAGEKCNGCGLCERLCPVQNISMESAGGAVSGAGGAVGGAGGAGGAVGGAGGAVGGAGGAGGAVGGGAGGKKPVWHGNCTHCMACICHCPSEAIEYGRKSVGKPRYHID